MYFSRKLSVYRMSYSDSPMTGLCQEKKKYRGQTPVPPAFGADELSASLATWPPSINIRKVNKMMELRV